MACLTIYRTLELSLYDPERTGQRSNDCRPVDFVEDIEHNRVATILQFDDVENLNIMPLVLLNYFTGGNLFNGIYSIEPTDLVNLCFCVYEEVIASPYVHCLSFQDIYRQTACRWKPYYTNPAPLSNTARHESDLRIRVGGQLTAYGWAITSPRMGY